MFNNYYKFHLTQSAVCGIIKSFATTGKTCPGRVTGRKLKLSDRKVRLFLRYISKNRHLTLTNQVIWARQTLKNYL